MTDDKDNPEIEMPASANLPVVVESRVTPRCHRRWRHSSAFIAQLAGQMSERRRDRLHHWRRPQVAGDAYGRAQQSNSKRDELKVV